MDYVDGALAAEPRSVFDRHLAACPACRDYLNTYQTAVRLGREAFRDAEEEAAEPPRELVEAILASRRSEWRSP